MVSVAAELKSEREKRRVTLAQIAEDTHISLRHLENLEEGRYGDLPGGIYTRAFLRAYCETLNLNQSAILERYELEVSPHSEKHFRTKGQIRTGGIFFRINPIVIWSLMLLVSATGIFLSRKWIAEIFSPYFSHSSAPAAPYKSLTIPPSDAPEPVNGTDTESLAPAQSSPEPSEPAQTAEVSDDEGATTSHASLESIRLEIAATEKCWISIDRDGIPVARKLLHPGEVESFGAMDKLLIILGNAGGVHLKINGTSSRQLGESGEVLRLLITQKTISNLLDETVG